MAKFKVGDKVSFKDDPRYIVYEVVGIHYDTLEYYLETDNPDGNDYLIFSFREEFKLYKNESILEESAKRLCLDDYTPKKFDSGKPRMDLVRPEFTLALGEALGYGADKYSEKRGETPNFLQGEGHHYSKIIASLERHVAAFKMGIDIDEESGLHHLALAAANLMFLHTYSLTDIGVDDRMILNKKGVDETEEGSSERTERRSTTKVEK